MKNLLRKLVAPLPIRPPILMAGAHADAQDPWNDMAIAAWSEVMGRDAAELWIAANNSRSTGGLGPLPRT
jgi:hypothetical protein